jgi:hypothetical protein
MEMDKIMSTLLTLETNWSIPRRHGSGKNNENITNNRGKSSTPRRHGSGQNNENITNARSKLTRALHEDMEVDKIMRPLLTLGENSSTPRRHGSGKNNENITNTRDHLEHSTKTWKWTK